MAPPLGKSLPRMLIPVVILALLMVTLTRYVTPLTPFSPLDSLTLWPPLVLSAQGPDQPALVAFWDGLTDKGALGWNTTLDLCGQSNVICSPASDGKVVQLWGISLFSGFLGSSHSFFFFFFLKSTRTLGELGLTGTLSTELGLLTSLTYLYFTTFLHFLCFTFSVVDLVFSGNVNKGSER